MLFNLSLKQYEGPIELLDSLIRERKIDIFQINIAEIAEQYLDFIKREINTIDIDDATKFLEMSLYLLNLKAKKAIPIENQLGKDSSFEYERDKLIQRIIEYRKYKEVVEKIITKKEQREKMFSKSINDIEHYSPKELIVEQIPTIINPNKLFIAITNAFEKYRMSIYFQKKIIVQELSVGEVEKDLWEFLCNSKAKEISFAKYLSVIDQFKISQQYIVTTFLAILDLVRYQKIRISQKTVNSDLIITTLQGEKNG